MHRAPYDRFLGARSGRFPDRCWSAERNCAEYPADLNFSWFPKCVHDREHFPRYASEPCITYLDIDENFGGRKRTPGWGAARTVRWEKL